MDTRWNGRYTTKNSLRLERDVLRRRRDRLARDDPRAGKFMRDVRSQIVEIALETRDHSMPSATVINCRQTLLHARRNAHTSADVLNKRQRTEHVPQRIIARSSFHDDSFVRCFRPVNLTRHDLAQR